MVRKINFANPEILRAILLTNKKIDKTTKCWNWNGRKTKAGYGQTGPHGHHLYVHRASYAMFNGPISEGMDVCHKCDNPSCYRPEHLFLGTARDNLRDCSAKGRMTNRPNRKINAEIANKIRFFYKSKEFNQIELSKKYGVSQTLVWQIVNDRKYQNLGNEEIVLSSSVGAKCE
jgi:hypothetical protein